jgi:LysR family transcriptional regulator for metE and metH
MNFIHTGSKGLKPMHLEIRHLKMLVAVSEEKSITKAGNRLHLTQSALSHQLKYIEERLSTPLFKRLDKKMLLTPAGERLLGSAKLVLDELVRAEEDVRHIASERKGVLRISTQCYTCYNWLPELLVDFNQSHPGVEVDIVVEATRQPIEALLDGKLDVAIVNRKVRDRRLVFKPLFKDELVVIVSPRHRLTRKPFVKAEDLADEKLIIHGTPHENIVFQNLLFPSGVAPKHVSQVQLTEAIIEMVKAGLGVGLMATWSVREQIDNGSLCALRLTPRGFHRQWSAAFLNRRTQPKHLLAFVNLVAKRHVHAPRRAS